MNIETQTTPELKHIAGLIEDIATSMLTTIEANGSLASRPMYALEMEASGALWFFTDTRSSKVERLGVANLALLKFVPHSADYWDAPNSKMVRAVSNLVSIVAGKPIGMGEHGSHQGLSSGSPA